MKRGQKGAQHMAKIPALRADRLLASMGYGSRSEVAHLAKLGRISLDGTAIEDVSKRISITPDLTHRLQINGEFLDPLPGMVLMLNKPLGMTCSHKDGGALVHELLPPRWRRRDPVISTIGRLDKQTSGLLLLTDDGALLHKIISPRNHIRKIYRAGLARPLNGDEAAIFSSGLMMLEGETKPLAPATLQVLSDTEVLLEITEGRYHQVRRMFAAVGNHVQTLHRETIGALKLPNDLTLGQMRLLTHDELQLIFQPAA